MWSQDIRQAHNHVFVHQQHALQLASAMWVWNREPAWCVNCLSIVLILPCMSLVSRLQTKIVGTSSCRASLCALSTMLRAMFSQYMPTTWPCLKKSVSSSFLQFSILRVRSCRKWSSDKGAAGVHVSHGCCDFWQMNIQESLRLFQVNHCFDAHQSCLSCIMFSTLCPSTTSSYPHFSWHIFWTWFWQPYPNILFWHSWHIFGPFSLTHSFWTFLQNISAANLSDLSCDILQLLLWPLFLGSSTPHSTRNIAVGVQHATLNSHYRGWGPARHTQHAISRLGSSTPHWTRNIAVGVQHATLNTQYRGWGPARHTELAISRLGSSTPHRTHKIAVGVQHATLNWENASCNWGPSTPHWTERIPVCHCGPARHTEHRGSQLIEENDEGGEDKEEEKEKKEKKKEKKEKKEKEKKEKEKRLT